MCMAWLYDGSILITGGKDSTVKVWMLKDKYPRSLSLHTVSPSLKPLQVTRAV